MGWAWGFDSQLTELLARLPSVGPDPADGVLAQVELLQHQQAVQPALAHLRQVVVIQVPVEVEAVEKSTVKPPCESLPLRVRGERRAVLTPAHKQPYACQIYSYPTL